MVKSGMAMICKPRLALASRLRLTDSLLDLEATFRSSANPVFWKPGESMHQMSQG